MILNKDIFIMNKVENDIKLKIKNTLATIKVCEQCTQFRN